MRTRVLVGVIFALAGLRAVAQTTPLRDLLAEADKNNAEIQAATKDWKASTYSRAQVSSLPATQFSLQELSVGSPRPGAGLSNNNFAYVGIGASQEFPYPGKLRLKGLAADAAADEQFAEVDVVRSRIGEQVKAAYLRLAYLQQTLTMLNASRFALGELIEGQLARYSAGQGSQANILTAQLERTKLLREITMHHQQMAQAQADLKAALNRQQESADVIADELRASPIARSIAEALHDAEQKSPILTLDERVISRQQADTEAARLAGKPDFSAGYVYQRTGLDFPAYYMGTLSVMFPRKKRAHAEQAEASERLAAVTLMREAHRQQQLSEVRKQYAAVLSTEEELSEYRDGILPQGEAAYNSALAALRSNTQTLDAVLAALNANIEFQREFAQALLDHEMALVRLETMTGEVLR
jgi:cobalt-zinc-cadmium efflux system outer membrane protein